MSRIGFFLVTLYELDKRKKLSSFSNEWIIIYPFKQPVTTNFSWKNLKQQTLELWFYKVFFST